MAKSDSFPIININVRDKDKKDMNSETDNDVERNNKSQLFTSLQNRKYLTAAVLQTSGLNQLLTSVKSRNILFIPCDTYLI